MNMSPYTTVRALCHLFTLHDTRETIEFLQKAADNTEQALGHVHHYKNSSGVQSAVKRLGTDALQLMKVFPKIRREIEMELA
jgi:hypothetical protein